MLIGYARTSTVEQAASFEAHVFSSKPQAAKKFLRNRSLRFHRNERSLKRQLSSLVRAMFSFALSSTGLLAASASLRNWQTPMTGLNHKPS